MCQYSSDNGHATDWHLVHIGVGHYFIILAYPNLTGCHPSPGLRDARCRRHMHGGDCSCARRSHLSRGRCTYIHRFRRKYTINFFSPQGLWTDSQIEPLQRIVNFSHAHGTKIGIQLAHAGRKASTHAPWVRHHAGRDTALEDENGWPDSSEILHLDKFPRQILISLFSIWTQRNTFSKHRFNPESFN